LSWELASFLVLGAVLLAGFAWYERSRPSSQVVALVAALAALAIAGRIAFAAFPNVKPTTDIVIFAGYALGPAPGFAVGGLTALVSNFWFGQGPWTPWQMAGWGLCGILGAGLAIVRPRAGRLTLAAVCALAGIAYGALLNFSLMATYGGDLSMQRFLALESRAVPFDAAHAIGNATLALIAGPAMVRMLTRFRRRFEWRTAPRGDLAAHGVPSAPRPGVAAVLLILAMVVLAGVLPAPAQAVSRADRAALWLTAKQNSDGGWGPSPSSDSSASTTAWAMLGFEAVGHNPLDAVRDGHSPVDYLRSRVGELSSPGDFARTILALEGAGVNPRSFGGHDLVRALVKRQRSNGSYEGWPGSTAFAVMALRAAGAEGIQQSIEWLAKVQNADGGWGDVPGSPSTADGTGAVMQAIPHTSAANHALGFLRKHQRSNGGFGLGASGEDNSQSTAWAVQGMVAVGADPSSVRTGGNSALDYLAARQADDGHYHYSSSSDQTPVWVTGQVLAAVARKAFPLEPVPQESTSTVPPASDQSAGSGGEVAPTETAPAEGSLELPDQSGGTGVAPPAAPAPSTGAAPSAKPRAGGTAASPPTGGPEGEGAESPDAAGSAPPFEASDDSGPEPWIPLGIGLATAALALASVLFLGRRFSW
jgi:energy-coupling factor transport system substrate-specific component